MRISDWSSDVCSADLVPSANRITLLRDANGDGMAEVKTPFITDLYSPSGMALVGSTLYVANADAVVAFPSSEERRVGKECARPVCYRWSPDHLTTNPTA